MTIYGYARVSTGSQDFPTQLELLEKSGCEIIFKEKHTGSKINRPEFIKLKNLLKKGDTFVVTKLDRFARSTIEGLTTTKELFERGVSVHILNQGLIENTPNGRLILTQLFAFAEYERDMIIERTQEGKAFAKKNDPNFKDGRPKKFTKDQLDLAFTLLENNSVKKVSKMTGISESTLYREKRRRENIII
ncbi:MULTISPECIES: recombinase family protein [Vagococcus]|uniref:Site-specific recombinase, DNA invertase Pin related protein n=1 Tax=Vagococcus fluvialis bH819 TaxID=1255619 RepID=A0A1X6WS65_9ENTE|nr:MULTISPECIES: recombinase family protein [Vagococcus]SLM87125.1 Site-specific recombinase, DNA invertase Pin related protein [Vagococcus fluvialis bH819]HCM90596.1 recombinase family protein [Vagococcus sp.]